MNLKLWALIGLLSVSVDGLIGQSLTLKPADRRAEAQVAMQDSPLNGSNRLELAPGLTATLWAAEPQLANPVAISLDDRGRLYVAETYRYRTSALDIADYPQLLDRDLASRTGEDQMQLLQSAFGDQVAQLGSESERVRVLEDTNRDGKADDSHVFAEGFNKPSDGMVGGILAERDQVWLTSSPALWKFSSSTTANAAVREEFIRGLGVHIGSPAHGAHGIARGPDGMLYFTVGDRGANIIHPSEASVSVPDSGAVFRCYPDGSRVEVVATGLNNPQDLAFDEFGNLFTVDTEEGEGNAARFVHIVEGSDSGWRVVYRDALNRAANPWMGREMSNARLRQQPAYLLPAIGNINGGASGMAYHPGSGSMTEYRGTFLVSHFRDNLADSGIRTYTIKPDGAGFVLGTSGTLLRGAFATDLAFGPDSRLYFSDWVSKWPWPKPGRGRIYAVEAVNVSEADRAAAAETRGLLEQGMAARSPQELATLVGHVDQRIRLAAQFALVARGETSLPIFQRIAADARAPRLARLHALWGAGQLAEHVPGALNHLPSLLRDHDPEVRAQSAKLLGDYQRFEAFQSLTAALKDTEPRVAFFAAQSLGKIKRTEAIPHLIELLRRNDDNDLVLRHAAIVALARLGSDPALANTVRDPSHAVRIAGLLVYRRLGDMAAGLFLDDSDSDIVREAAIAINDTPIEAAMPALAAMLDQAPLDDAPLILRAINAHFRLGRPENAKALAEFASRSYVPASFRAEALNRLGDWAKPSARDVITGLPRPLDTRDPEPARDAFRNFISQMSGKTPEEVQVASINAVAALQIPGTGHALWDVVFQEAHPVRARIAALQALEHLKDARLEVAVQHATRSTKLELRLAAVPILSRLDAVVALPMLKILATHGTAPEQRAVYPILGRMSDERADEILIAALHRLRAGELPLGAQAELIEAAATSQSPKVTAELKRIRAEWRASKDPLASYRSALEGGDKAKGRELFEKHPQLACLQCHERDRTTATAGRSVGHFRREDYPEKILAALLHHGVNLPVHGLEPTVTAIAKNTINDPESRGSPSAGSFVELLSPTDLRDLIAYLATLRDTPE